MKTKRSKALLLCAIATWMTMPIMAQSAEIAQDYTVVVKADKAKEIAKQKSQSIDIITKQDIAEKKAKSLEDVIYSQTGVTRTVDAMGRVGVAIRGAEARHTLVMTDGVPVLGDVSKYSGASDETTRLGVQNVERVVITHGAASAHYGSGAIGGVINVVTKAPAKKPTITFNVETTRHNQEHSEEDGVVPKNYFLRVDSGQHGKFKGAFFASKRDIMPVYKQNLEYQAGVNWYGTKDFKPSLRFFGSAITAGGLGEVQINDHQTISIKGITERENLQRRNKSAEPLSLDALFEPMQVYKRKLDRNTYDFTFKSKGKVTDMAINYNHSVLNEKDATLLTYFGAGQDDYAGQNVLNSVDFLNHKRDILNVDFASYPNEKHTLNYGFGMSNERASGSRLQNAPNHHVVNINPWDYDNSLAVDQDGQGNSIPASNVHRYHFVKDDKGFMWDKNYEIYGGAPPVASPKDVGDYFVAMMMGDSVDPEVYARVKAFDEVLRKENKEYFSNPNIPFFAEMSPSAIYYITDPAVMMIQEMGLKGEIGKVKYNGVAYGQDYVKRNNQVVVGEGSLRKQHAYFEDVWQVTPNTKISPIVRLDHSNLFGSHITTGVGMVHNYKGNPNTRIKANVGTAYAEPGLGELYYNWQMFGSTGPDRLGWYWIGNTNLQPEKSINFDVSYEHDSKDTNIKATLFHNSVRDYMTAYFTGQVIDFTSLINPNSSFNKLDRIYSFKNIGKAKITGLEFDLNHRFIPHWSAKLGYTWLHAMNKSDDTMPDRLLDRPTHKVDLSVHYENKKGGVDATVWGDYMIHMLDSNTVGTEGLFKKDSKGNYVRTKATYKEKTFGIWHAIVNKKINDATSAYVGVDNIFNHQDDDRAIQDRTYRMGLSYTTNLELSSPKDLESENREAGDTKLFGVVQVTNKVYTGSNAAPARFTRERFATKDARVLLQDLDSQETSVNLQIGVDAKVADNTRIIVKGNTKKDSKNETKDTNKLTIEQAELSHKAGKWNYSVGKLKEAFGSTGYWFNDSYVGGRVVYDRGATQVRVGYGDFSDATGFNSAYTFAQDGASFFRIPSVQEFTGMTVVGTPDVGSASIFQTPGQDYKTQKVNYRMKFNTAGENEKDPVKKADAKLAVMQEFASILKTLPGFKDSPKVKIKNFLTDKKPITEVVFNYRNPLIIVKTKDGTVLDWTKGHGNGQSFRRGFENKYNKKFEGYNRLLDPNVQLSWEEALDKQKIYNLNQIIMDTYKKEFEEVGDKITFIDEKGNTLTDKEMLDRMYVAFVGDKTDAKGANDSDEQGFHALSFMLSSLISRNGWDPYNGAAVPLKGAPASYLQTGKVLLQDRLPEMKRTGFISIKRHVNPHVTLNGWYLKTFDGGMNVPGKVKDTSDSLNVANVLGIGATYRTGALKFSIDYGVNTSDTGKYFHNGRNSYSQYDGGSAPTFFIARVGVGEADDSVRGSWSAYMDYKAMEHGSFFGGNGTNALPDYYLDGIKSMTVGLSYVPVKNMTVDASYTFGAKGLDTRDTLFTKQEFSLGNYSRVRVTYRF